MSLNLGNIWSNNNVGNKKINKSFIRKTPKTLTVKPKLLLNKGGTRKTWGNATWYLFHSIAAKINSEWYRKNYTIVWNFITACCSNLPCPFCRNHAMSYVKNVNITSINTKEKLIKTLFDFHNHVNTNARNPIYKWEEMSRYENANMTNIFRNFEINFFKMYYNQREFNGWIRNKFKSVYHDFYNTTKNLY